MGLKVMYLFYKDFMFCNVGCFGVIKKLVSAIFTLLRGIGSTGFEPMTACL